MKGYVVALPGPDGDGYISLNSTTVGLLRGEVLPNHAQADEHGQRDAEPDAHGYANPGGSGSSRSAAATRGVRARPGVR